MPKNPPQPSSVPAARPLLKCPRWATMQWLPEPVVSSLDKAVADLNKSGLETTRGEVICATALSFDPSEADLSALVRHYKQRLSKVHPRPSGRTRGVPLLVRMPSPISLRIDGLVESVREEGLRAYRHEVVGALINLAASRPRQEVEAFCEAYRAARARDAAFSGLSIRKVLSQEKPRPGARPQWDAAA